MGSLGDQIGEQSDELDRVNGELASRNRILNDVLFANEQQFLLTSTAQQPEPGIRVYWNRQANVMVLHAFELYPPDAGTVFQLWFLDGDGTVIPSQTFTTAADGHGLVSVAGPANPDGLVGAAVSVEPADGSDQPTTTPILYGEVGSD